MDRWSGPENCGHTLYDTEERARTAYEKHHEGRDFNRVPDEYMAANFVGKVAVSEADHRQLGLAGEIRVH